MGTLSEDTAAGIMAALGLQGAPTERVLSATAATVELARVYVDPDALEPPDNPAVRAGLVALGVRVYQDPASPSGVLGSEGYTGAYVPEDLLTHVRHYFDPYRATSARGIA